MPGMRRCGCSEAATHFWIGRFRSIVRLVTIDERGLTIIERVQG